MLERVGVVNEQVRPLLSQLNIIASDVAASIAFYRRLGLDVPDGPDHEGIRHVEIEMPGGIHLDLDGETLARVSTRYGGGPRAAIAG
jgi:catechol 2,3-dioxygenase-like lactoylglutathione lyase family enzyme